MKRIPIGADDFKSLILSCGYYVDKTRFIKDLFDTALLVKVQLFTRPRRFGKTLFLSLLKAFLEPNYKDKSDLSEHEKIFKDLDIFKDKEFCDEFMGKYPVISLNLKEGYSTASYEDSLTRLKSAMSDCATKLSFLNVLPLSTYDRQSYESIKNNDFTVTSLRGVL